jgi:hypothetical protein
VVDVSLLESFPFLTSFYENGRAKFQKNFTEKGLTNSAHKSLRLQLLGFQLSRSAFYFNPTLACAAFLFVVIGGLCIGPL